MRPLFHGLSPESVANSIRSALSLHSLRSSQPDADDREHLRNVGCAISQSEGDFVKLPDTSAHGSLENHITSIELDEQKDNKIGDLGTTEGVPGIVVHREFDARADRKV